MSAWAARPPERLPAWQRLGALAEKGRRAGVGNRFEDFSARLGPLLVDYSRQRIDDDVRRCLVALAVESGLEAAIDDLFAGAPINNTEQRAAGHTVLRQPKDACPPHAARMRERFLEIAQGVRDGSRRGFTGRPFECVLHIGIGGSHLGPELCLQALGSSPDAPAIRFLANVDGAAGTAALAGLDPATTLVVVASKSFKTLETRLNAQLAKSWFLERTCNPEAFAKHFLAATANMQAAREFGLPAANCLDIGDSTGGRFSLWSAAGLPVAVALGRAGFEDLLAGAHLVDRHFQDAPLDANLPLLLALLQVWNTNFGGAATHAVLAYDHRLRALPSYLQQLEMESNGKSVRRDGEPTGTHTAPVVWGGEETNGQHAFHQLLHQGTRAFSADLIACIRPGHRLPDHHRWLLANCLAQGEAMRDGERALSRGSARGLAPSQGRALSRGSARGLAPSQENAEEPHRRVAGDRPTTTILLDALTPRALGALLALYEHKTFCLGALWQVNSFDQWGVELGKALAEPIHAQLAAAPRSAQALVTAGLLATIKARS